jgi:hypothetical protein
MKVRIFQLKKKKKKKQSKPIFILVW